MRLSKISGAALLIMVSALSLAACGGAQGQQSSPSSTDQKTKQVKTVKVNFVGLVSDAPVLIAQARGYLEQEGIKVEKTQVTSGSTAVGMLSTGMVDMVAGAPNAGLNNAVSSGVKLKIIADKGQVTKGYSYATWVVRADLKDKIKDWQDLKGRTIAINGGDSGVPPVPNLAEGLAKAGLKYSDVTVKSLTLPDSLVALANKSVDAAYLVEPLVVGGVAQGTIVNWKGLDEAVPFHQIGVLVISEKFAKDRETVVGFMKAYIKAIADYHKAFVERSDPKLRDEIIKLLMENTTIKDRTQYDTMIMPWFDKGARLNLNSLSLDQDWYIKLGLQTQGKVDLSTVVDNSYVEDARRALGGS